MPDANPFEWLKRAQECQTSGHHPEALEAYRRFLELRPDHAGAWADLGGLLMNLDRLPEALEACSRAMDLDPALPYARVNLACTIMKQGRLEEARGLLLGVRREHPERLDARLALSECLIRLKAPTAALAEAEGALKLDPTNATAYNHLIHIHSRYARWQELEETIARRLRVVPGCPSARMERAFLHLLLGRLPEAWDEYETRFEVPDLVVSVVDTLGKPRWEGQPFPDQTLLLHWEQGFGDTLMFIRYAARAKVLGGTVVALVQPALADLVATCPGVDQVVAHGQPLPPFDLHLPLMSLPKVFRTDLESIPGEVPYLGLPERIPNLDWISQVLQSSRGMTRVGYAWAGRPEYRADAERSIAPELLSPLAQLPGVAWHCFQLPTPSALPLPSVPLGPLLSNFSDTAYALGGMDLVITVDTALAHAAGALGVPTLLLLPFDPDWRWLLDRSDSPWYPTLRLYRQPRPGDWEAVLQSVLADLSG